MSTSDSADPAAGLKTNTETKTKHVACCHCQAIRFTVKVPPLENNGICDCSHCSKRGIIWGQCAADDFVLERGREHLKEYEFGAKTFKHLFCDICSTLIAAGPSAVEFPAGDTIGYNVRCIRDVDMHTLPTTRYSGIDRQPPYIPASPMVHSFEDKEGKIVMTGSCHCGKIKLAVQTRPLGVTDAEGKMVEVLDCNCSMCSGNGQLWMYPLGDEYQLFPTPLESPSSYSIYSFHPPGPNQSKYHSCSTCGCGIIGKRVSTPNGGVGLNIRLIDEPMLDLGKVGVELWSQGRKYQGGYAVDGVVYD